MNENKNSSRFQWHYLYLPILALVILLITLFKINENIEPVNQPFTNSASDDLITNQWNKVIPGGMTNAGVPGLVVAAIKNGQLVSSAGYGKTISMVGNPIHSSSLFEGASLSKPLTALAVLKLVHENKLHLDSMILDKEQSYTVRQLLSHTAGFDNALGRKLVPTVPGGSFFYSGQGYLKLGQLISEVTGETFENYMNREVLPKIGMTSSYFGEENNTNNEGKPHISVTMPQSIGAILFAFSTLLFTLFIWLGLLLFKKRVQSNHQQLVLLLSALIVLILPLIFFGTGNGLRFALVNLLTGLLIWMMISGIRKLRKRPKWSILVIAGAVPLIYSLWLRPPIPLENRVLRFSPAAGLKTTVEDYARFGQELMNPTIVPQALIDEMISSQVNVNENNDWGLGVGIQISKTPVIWHWGVNYPGYQAFFMYWPQHKDGLVVLMNGGFMSLTTGNVRFSGLELARDIAVQTFGGQHLDYWQQVQ